MTLAALNYRVSVLEKDEIILWVGLMRDIGASHLSSRIIFGQFFPVGRVPTDLYGAVSLQAVTSKNYKSSNSIPEGKYREELFLGLRRVYELKQSFRYFYVI